jgi:hypothetical protein
MKNRYKILDDYAIVYCNRKGMDIEVIVDIESIPIMDSYPGTWGIDEDHRGRMYCKLELNPGRIYLHRLLTNCPKGKVVDHIDGNSLNNRLSNLRVTTQSNNLKNMKRYSTNTSGITGVSYKKSHKKWVAKVKNKELGLFDCKYEAGRVVTAERLKLGMRVDRKPIKLLDC